jgi:6-phospho-beta-glucosidase
MKLTVLGGGGVRSPLFIAAAVRHSSRIGLDELCLMDIDAEKLRIFGGLGKLLTQILGVPLKVTLTTDPQAALDGASYVVTTIRVGNEQGRVFDERIALEQGVLGQETTGAGGFGMALRSIPAILDYAGLLEKLNPQAWMFNFTNPAGLVTQALRDAGFSRTIGICDSANAAQHAVGQWQGIESQKLKAEVFGLNHLSWTRRVTLDGKDLLASLLSNPDFRSKTLLRLFDPELIEDTGMWMNEYLFYFYYTEKAIQSLVNQAITRGEEVAMLNHQLIEQMRTINLETDSQTAIQAYMAYILRRGATYMQYDQVDHPAPSPQEIQRQVKEYMDAASSEEAEGYAGVAFNLIEAFEGDTPLFTGLNVPNEDAIDCMRPTDVVEVSCRVDRNGVKPLKIGAIPESQELLIRSVKAYERLVVEAVQKRSRRTAIRALVAHPLIRSYPRATALVDGYLNAHAAYIGKWK